MLLAAVAVLAITTQGWIALDTRVTRLSLERELIFRGEAYRRAIASYHQALPDRPAYPPSLEHLLADPRFPQRRHIRRLYPDPLDPARPWETIRNDDGGIMGVRSLDPRRPLKQQGFPKRLAHLEDREHYSEWVFLYEPETAKAKEGKE